MDLIKRIEAMEASLSSAESANTMRANASINERIERLQAEMDALNYKGLAMQTELNALKAEAEAASRAKARVFELWVPANKYYAPDVAFGGSYECWNKGSALPLARGLAFQSEADAVEVGKYLAVVGKLANAAKQLNAGKTWHDHVYYCIVADKLNGLQVDDFTVTTSHGPRFHSREAAEVALALLSDDEKQTLVKGIA